jgi:putative methionine-R-sulfoxide reductase with GAF domain
VGPDVRAFCTGQVEHLLRRLSRGEVEELLHDEAREAAATVRGGGTLHARALAYTVFDRCCLPFLAAACREEGALAECLLALDELQARRLGVLLRAQEEESGRRLQEAQDQAARAAERARELLLANEALRRSEAKSQHRAEQIGLLGSVAHRIAAILDPERLLQEAAETIQARRNHTYVAVVVLDNEGVLVGRWAGRPGVGRRKSGRTQGPAGGIIGRALRKRAPQVVSDVSTDADYHADVPGTHSEMVIPLLDGGEVVGALDFQADRPQAFDLDDVAVGETLAEFLVVALRNARLFAEARGRTPE